MFQRCLRTAICIAAFASTVACTGRRAQAPAPPSPIASESFSGSAGTRLSNPHEPQFGQPSRQIIRRGQIDAGVKSLPSATARLASATSALGGQLDRSTVEDERRATFLIRVPPVQLEPLMDSVATLGDVESRSVGSEDVTERVIDAEARLGSLRASRDRLRQLLERSENVQDVIAVERELARVQGEIESLEGRLNALRGQVAMSELSVSLGQRPVLGPLGVAASGLGTLVKKLFVWR